MWNPLNDNPIARREWAQWRRSRAFWIAPLVLVVALAALLVRFCAQQAGATDDLGPPLGSPPGPRALAFVALAASAMALLLPPALAAPAIASEREARLLEGLHLSHLHPREIIAGKWCGAFARALWMLGASLPVHVACVQLGGISTRQVLGVWACEIVFAGASSAFGIFCSAWGRTALSATRSAYGFGVLHAIACFNALSVAALGRLALVPIPMRLSEPFQSIAAWVGATHPLVATGLSWWQPWRSAAARTDIAPLLGHPLLLWSLALQVLAIAALLALACPGVRRPFEVAPFIEPRKRKGNWRGAQAPRKGAPPASLGWWELPVGFGACGRNPVHGREFVTKFRMRAVPRAVLVAEGVLAVGVAVFYARTFWLGLFEPGSRGLIWWALLLVGMLVGMTSLLVLGATGIARERELGTWESLRLSFLSPREVISGKVSAMLWASALFSIPFWPLLALCVHGWRTSAQGIGVVEAVCSLLILASMAWSHGAFGLWLSARMKSSSATLCAMAAMFGWDLLLPLATMGTRGQTSDLLLGLNALFNPVLALLNLMSAPRGLVASATIGPVLALTLGGALLLWHLHLALSREWRASKS